MPLNRFSEAEKRQILHDFGNKDHLNVFCGDHGYVGSPLPPTKHDCSKCWFAYFYWSWATTPVHLKQERLEQMESMIYHMQEAIERGEGDTVTFVPQHKIEVIKED